MQNTPRHTEFYDRLGISFNDDREQIDRAYRKLASQYHPDRANNETEQLEYADRFRKITQAYETLTDPRLRQRYNRWGEEALKVDTVETPKFNRSARSSAGVGAGTGAGAGSGIGGRSSDRSANFTRNMVAARLRKKMRVPEPVSEPVELTGRISLADAYTGKELILRFEQHKFCVTCQGVGALEQEDCDNCDGSGKTVNIEHISNSSIRRCEKACAECAGQGVKILKKCLKCHGSKTTKSMSQVIVQVPPGVQNKTIYQFDEEGHQRLPHHTKSEVVVKIEINHNTRFYRRKNNLYHHMKIELVESLCGGTRTIETLDGRQLVLTFKRTVQSESVYMIRREGMPDPTNPQIKGDLIIKFSVHLPGRVTDSVKQEIERLIGMPKSVKLPKIKETARPVDLLTYDGSFVSQGDLTDPERVAAEEKKIREQYGVIHTVDSKGRTSTTLPNGVNITTDGNTRNINIYNDIDPASLAGVPGLEGIDFSAIANAAAMGAASAASSASASFNQYQDQDQGGDYDQGFGGGGYNTRSSNKSCPQQ